MCHRSGLPRTGSSRTSWTARTLALMAPLLFAASRAGAQPPPVHPADTSARSSSAVELAAGACRLERWAAAVDLMHVVEPRARRAQDWLCLARAQLHTGQWVAALDSYDELVESESAVQAPPRVPAKDRSGKASVGKAGPDRLAPEVEARQLGAIERQELEQQLGWIQIVPSASLPASVKLSLDGETISHSRVGVAFPVQPGRHAFAVEVSGVVRELDHWRVAPGERRRVNLSLPAEPRARQAVASPSAAQRQLHPQLQPHAAPRSDLSRWARGTLYAGGIGASAGIALLAASSADGNAHEGWASVGLGSMLLGGVAILTGAGLYVADAIVGSSPKEAPPAASRRPALEPWVSTNSAGVSGRF
jgi:hypothetical protein